MATLDETKAALAARGYRKMTHSDTWIGGTGSHTIIVTFAPGRWEVVVKLFTHRSQCWNSKFFPRISQAIDCAEELCRVVDETIARHHKTAKETKDA